MPRQELFFEERIGNKRIEVVKTYDRSYAREVFDSLSNDARAMLALALDVKGNYEPGDIPDSEGSDYDDFLWQEMCDEAREDVRQDPNLYSFFVVSESESEKADDLYVSPDWPSAENFAKKRLSK
jgi:hypothetical protein